MLGNFTFHNPTKLIFGEDSLSKLSEELKNYGPKVMLVYGGGSIKKYGIYDLVMSELEKAGSQVVELSGVMPNPTIEKVIEGARLARQENIDLILGVAAVPLSITARRWPAAHGTTETLGRTISRTGSLSHAAGYR